jgi:O-antigen/teichoic acid export membrane protein
VINLEQTQTGLLAGSAAFFFSSLFIFAARVASSVIVARTLGVEGKGTYTLVLMLGALLTLFLSMGINGSITYLAASRQFTAKHLFSFSVVSSIALSILGGLLFYILYVSFLSTSFLTGITNAEILLVLISLPINMSAMFLSGILLGKQQLLAQNAINILRVVSQLILLILSTLLQGGVYGAVLSWLISSIISLIATLWMLRSEFFFRFTFPIKILRPAISFGTKNYIANLFTFFNYRLDSFLVNFFSGPASVGLYSVSVSTAELIWYIPNAISSALFPKSSTLDKGTAARLTAQACRQTLSASTFLAIIFAVVGPFLIPLIYGADFQDSIPAFFWLLPGILGVSLSKIISANLSGAGKPQYATYTSTITVVLTIVLDIALIPAFGIVGAAVATSIAYLASAVLSVVWFQRESQLRWTEVVVPRTSDLTTLVNRTYVLISSLKR